MAAMVRIRVLLTVMLAFAGVVKAETPVAAAELQRMEQALGTLSFSGVVVFSRDGQLDALRVQRVAGGASPRELIERLTGPSLPLQRDAAGTWLAEGPRFLADAGGGDQGVLPDRAAGYELAWVTEDRVAGRVASVVDARARDSLRFGRRFWIDRDSGMLLRAAVFGADGILVEQWMFASFEPTAPDLPSALADDARPQVHYPAATAAAAARSAVRVEDVPSGFALISAAISADGEQLVFSDGLAKVSVFVEQLPREGAVLSGLQTRGALSVFGRLFEGRQVVVVGEVPPSTAERFAQGVARRNAS